MNDWIEQLVRELKGSLPGMVLLSLDLTDDGALAIGVLRVPFDSRGGWHGPRMLLAILAAADARGLDVVCTPTDAYGADKGALVRALGRAGFVLSPGDPSGHSMRRSGRRTVAGMSEAGDAAPAVAGWDCLAYGSELPPEVGALCFVADVGARVCRSQDECREQLGGEQRRVFRRINELAAAGGDPVMAYLAEAFPTPDRLLAGDDEARPPA
ncbi:hypothetical protein ACIBTV_27705 [Micromonospora sp. NPDC049366]|uniref:hypothetical protein n=1 Tax=Micromonospora sp. NPDC049366 TaxID=3364271 RepID=UPI003791BB2C